MKRAKKKIHWLESFSYPDIYPKYGLVWQIACKKKVPIEEDDVVGTTNPAMVNCKKCEKFANEARLSSIEASTGMKAMGFKRASSFRRIV